MLNQTVIIGRVVELLSFEKDEKKLMDLKLAVPRDEKNKNGEYITDLIPCQVNGTMAHNVAEYCSVDDLVGVKGRLAVIDNTLKLVGEKVTFLSTKK